MDPALVHEWVAGRSIARSLPVPVADGGGWRVDTGTAAETARWVFAEVGPGLAGVAAANPRPGHPLKACVDAATLRLALPAPWHVAATGHFMIAPADWAARPLAPGYRMSLDRRGDAAHVRIETVDGEPAASGHSGETDAALVFDRIETAPAHRRRGLGHAVMDALAAARRRRDARGLLVATDAGRLLYETIGWRVLAPYSTAWVPDDAPRDAVPLP